MSSLIAIAPRKESEWPLKDEGWGPLVDRPWASTSLHEFYGSRWQQIYRQHFLFIGGYPFQSISRKIARWFPLPGSESRNTDRLVKLAGDVGLVAGVFISSGILHNYPYYFYGPTIDPVTGVVLNATGIPGRPIVLFFASQFVGMGFERLFRAVSGKAVGGWLGALWTWVVCVGGFNLMSTSTLFRCLQLL